MNITIYTDGAARGNPGPGGYGTVLISGQFRKELSDGFELTTNNRMELLAVIIGLEALKIENSNVTIYSDSKYVVDAVEKGWIW
ncbi:MAG: RNase H family protein, partial [Prolixibacteraceae bacterium]